MLRSLLGLLDMPSPAPVYFKRNASWSRYFTRRDTKRLATAICTGSPL
jgi:hypothetical protein